MVEPKEPALPSTSPLLGRNPSQNLQPFPALPRFPVAALVLQFYGHRGKVKVLLLRLSHTSRAYFRKHKDILAAFAVLPAPVLETQYFGFQETYKPGKCTEFEWPTPEAVAEMVEFDDVKIKSFTVKQKRQQALYGIQINWTNGHSSPLFRCEKYDS